MHRTILAALCSSLVLGACGADRTATDPTAPDGPRDQEETMTTPTDPPPGARTPQARLAAGDLADRLGITEGEVEVTRVEAVTWNDASLGCAEEGFSYAQVLVEGSRITLEAGGERYEYHAGGGRDAFLCERPTQ